MTEKPGCGPSSPELRTSVANFMDRADEIRAHPLGGKHSSFKVTMAKNLNTGEVKPVGLKLNHLPKEQWTYLAVLVRPIVFAEKEPINLNVLTKRIEWEHPLLRGRLKMVRDDFKRWRKHMFVGRQQLGSTATPTPPTGLESIQKALGVPDPNDRADEVSNDYQFAWEYLNANVWHADLDKSERYQASIPYIKEHYAKCAEIRVLSATQFALELQNWLLDARADGHDF